MAITALDTHQTVKDLTAAGFTDAQAEALTQALRHVQQIDLSDLATKADLAAVRSEMATKADLKAMADMLATVHERLAQMVKAGKSVEEAVAAHPTREFDERFGQVRKPDPFVQVAYTSILRHDKA